MTRAMSRVITMDPNAGIQKLRAASCSVLLLLLTLALVASSLLVARYAVQASSWWLSLLAVTVCLLGLCTWIQLAASRAGRWRAVLARQMVLSRAQAAQAQARALRGVPGLGHDPYSCGGGAGRCGVATISTAITAEGGLDCQVPSGAPQRSPPSEGRRRLLNKTGRIIATVCFDLRPCRAALLGIRRHVGHVRPGRRPPRPVLPPRPGLSRGTRP